MRIVGNYEKELGKLRPEQRNVFESYMKENKNKVDKNFLADRLRFPASDVRKLNEYVKLVADETKQKNSDFQNLCQSVVALESKTRSLTPLETEQKLKLTPEQKIEQEILSLRLSAAADEETLRTLRKVLDMPFTGNNPDQKYLAEAKKNALKVLLRLGAA